MAWLPVTTTEGARAALAMRATCQSLHAARPCAPSLPWPWAGMGFLRTALAVGTGRCELCGHGDVLDVVERPCPVFAHGACTGGKAIFKLSDMTTPELWRVMQARVPLQTVITTNMAVLDAWAWRFPVKYMEASLAAQPVIDASERRFAMLRARATAKRCPPVPVHLQTGLAAHVAALRQRNLMKEAAQQRLLAQERELCQQRTRKRQRVESQQAAGATRVAKLDAKLQRRGLPTASAACAKFGMHAMEPVRSLAAPTAAPPRGASLSRALAAVEAAVAQSPAQPPDDTRNPWRRFEEDACRLAGAVPGVCPVLLMAWYTWATTSHEWPAFPLPANISAEVAVAALACSPGRHWQTTPAGCNDWLAVRAMQLGLTFSWRVSSAAPPSVAIIGLSKRHGWQLNAALKSACAVPASELRWRWKRREQAALASMRLPVADCPWEAAAAAERAAA